MTGKELFIKKILRHSVIYLVYNTFIRIDMDGDTPIHVANGEFFKDLKRISIYDNYKEYKLYVMTRIDLEKINIDFFNDLSYSTKDVYLFFNGEFRKTLSVDVIEIRDMKYTKFIKYFMSMEKAVWE